MFCKKFVFISILLLNGLLTNHLFSQNFTISGFVTNQQTGDIIVGAYVFCPQIGVGAITNNYGYYALNIPYGTKNIMYVHEDYQGIIDTLIVNRNKTINRSLLLLEEDMYQIDPFDNPTPDTEFETTENENDTFKVKRIVIKNSESINALIQKVLETNFKTIDRTENGFINISGQQINSMPSLGGEIDVTRSVKFLPGVMPGTELNNGMYIRGGSQDQNLVLMDGVPVYNMNHLYGFYSIFNSETVNSINVTKSGFSAKNGGRLSGITDVVTKEGNTDRVRGIYLNSLVALTLDVYGPLSKDGRTTFAISGKRSHWDLFTRGFSNDSNKIWYTFYDFNTKISHRFNDRSKLIVSLYSGRDRLYTLNSSTENNNGTSVYNKFSIDLRWGNLISSVKWNRTHNQKLFSSLSFNYSQYEANFGLSIISVIDSLIYNDKAEFQYKYRNFIRDINPKWDFEYTLDKKNTIHFGASASMKQFLPSRDEINYIFNDVLDKQTIDGFEKSIRNFELAAYAEDHINVDQNTKMSVGMRLVNYVYNSKVFIMPEPRLSYNKKIQNNYSIKASYSMMHQPLHMMANNLNSVFTDRWLPATDLIKPQRSQQISLGIAQAFKNNIELSFDGYYKWLDRVLETKEGLSSSGSVATAKNWEDEVILGTGWCYGIEGMLHKRKGNTSGWIGYNLSWAKRNTPGVNNGNDYYFQFDRRHYVNIVFQHRIDEYYKFNINMVFSTGNVQSIPTGKYIGNNGRIIYEYTERNNFRLPHTLRFDIGLDKIKSDDIFNESGFRFSIYNVMARNNPVFIYIDNQDVTKPVAKQRSYLMFIPGVTYYIKF